MEIQEAQNVAGPLPRQLEASTGPKKPNNIVGRMDLRRVGQVFSADLQPTGPPGQPAPAGAARSSIRPGFVGPAPMEADPDQQSRFSEKGRITAAKKKTPGPLEPKTLSRNRLRPLSFASAK